MDRMNEDRTSADVSLGAIYSGGDFGTGSQSTILSSALAGRVRLGNWTLSASLPYMRINSRSTIFTGIDATLVLVAPNTTPNKRETQGLGDLTLGASYTIAPENVPVELQLSGRAKVNTASGTSQLSSGEDDYALGADLSFPNGALTPFVSFSYRFLGDTPQYRLENGPAASVGTSYQVNQRTFVLVSYHYSRAATQLVSDAHELFAGASTKLGQSRLRLTAFATAGLSRGAAAASGGLSLSVGFGHHN